jgi:hypothetical protein
VFVLLAPAAAGVLALLVPAGGAAGVGVLALLVPPGRAAAPACARAWRWLSSAPAPNAGSGSLPSMLLALGARVHRFLMARGGARTGRSDGARFGDGIRQANRKGGGRLDRSSHQGFRDMGHMAKAIWALNWAI